jgi:glycosyltransferase involved in cell wall biosynthesis
MFVRGYLSKLAYAVAAVSLAKLSRSGHPPYQLVHAQGGETVLSAVAYRRAPVLASYFGSDLLGVPKADASFPLSSRIRRTVQRGSATLVSHTITKSREMHLALPRSCRSRDEVVPSGVDDSTFVPMPQDYARRLLGWDEDARIALFGGNPGNPGKRFWLAEAACKAASGRITDLQVKTLSCVDPADVPLMMNAADCLVFTSVTEGSPNVVKEALMCDLPVIATPAGDVRELLQGVSPSWVCEASVGVIADALTECLSAPKRSNGRSEASHLTTGAIAERVLSVYERVLYGQFRSRVRPAGDAPPGVSSLPVSSGELRRG